MFLLLFLSFCLSHAEINGAELLVRYLSPCDYRHSTKRQGEMTIFLSQCFLLNIKKYWKGRNTVVLFNRLYHRQPKYFKKID